MPWLESGLFQPLPAQPNPWFNFAIGKITNGFNFQRAHFCVHGFTPGVKLPFPKMKSAAFCACAAA